MIHSFAIKNQLFIPPQHSFPFGTSIPRGERVNSQIGKQNKKKYPKLPESVLFFTLKAAIIVHCIQPSYVRSDAVLLYILTGYVTAWRRETLQTESWSSTVFRNRALAEQRKKGGEPEENQPSWRRLKRTEWAKVNSSRPRFSSIFPQRTTKSLCLRGVGRWQGSRSWLPVVAACSVQVSSLWLLMTVGAAVVDVGEFSPAVCRRRLSGPSDSCCSSPCK